MIDREGFIKMDLVKNAFLHIMIFLFFVFLFFFVFFLYFCFCIEMLGFGIEMSGPDQVRGGGVGMEMGGRDAAEAASVMALARPTLSAERAANLGESAEAGRPAQGGRIVFSGFSSLATSRSHLEPEPQLESPRPGMPPPARSTA